MKLFILSFLCVCSVLANAQFFYNDVFAKKQINTQMQQFNKNGVKSITVKKLNADNELTEDFAISKKINENYSNIVTSSTVYGSTQTSNNKYNNYQLIETSSEKRNVFQTTTFTYNASNLTVVTTITYDSTINEELVEEHKYIYNNKGVVLQMLKTSNDLDTMLVNFKSDENNNIIEEEWFKNGRKIETYYYYYNSNHQITDIVRFNKKLGKLLPELLLEYNDNGQLYKQIEIPYGTSNYNIWVYFYLSNGLKDKELLYNKSLELQGKLLYTYQ